MNSTYQITCTADMHITPSPSWFSELASQDLSVLSCLFLWLAENYFLWLWRLNTKKFNWKKIFKNLKEGSFMTGNSATRLGDFWKFLATKSGPNIWQFSWLVKKANFLSKTCCASILGIIWKIWATFFHPLVTLLPLFVRPKKENERSIFWMFRF